MTFAQREGHFCFKICGHLCIPACQRLKVLGDWRAGVGYPPIHNITAKITTKLLLAIKLKCWTWRLIKTANIKLERIRAMNNK